MSGFSIVTNNASIVAQRETNVARSSLSDDVRRLSSGLRINSSADDPSGLAIAEGLKSQVGGYDRAAQNVQDAANASAVAEGALQTTTDILQRIRTLAVEGASDITSDADRSNLQAEVAQLLSEVNRISQNTSFNGIRLLDGSHSGPATGAAASISIATNASLAQGTVNVPLTNAQFASPPVASGTYLTTAIPGWTVTGGNAGVYNGNDGGLDVPASGQAAFQDNGTLTQTITAQPQSTYIVTFDAANYPGTHTPPTVTANGVNITPANINSINNSSFTTFTSQSFTGQSGSIPITFSGTNIDLTNVIVTEITSNANGTLVAGTSFSPPGGTGSVDGTIELQVINTGASIAAQETFFDSATGATTISPVLVPPLSTSALFNGVAITTGPFTTADVGATTFIKISQAVSAQTNTGDPALSIQSAALEGQTIVLGFPATSTAALRIANIDIVGGSSAAPSLAAEDAIGQIDHALETLLGQRSAIGAAAIRLQEDLENDNVAAVQLQASESAIRDVVIAGVTSSYTRDQILVQVGTQVIAQSNSARQELLTLFR